MQNLLKKIVFSSHAVQEELEVFGWGAAYPYTSHPPSTCVNPLIIAKQRYSLPQSRFTLFAGYKGSLKRSIFVSSHQGTNLIE
jgi:hypothetical protein